jgi:hypothetical protein
VQIKQTLIYYTKLHGMENIYTTQNEQIMGKFTILNWLWHLENWDFRCMFDELSAWLNLNLRFPPYRTNVKWTTSKFAHLATLNVSIARSMEQSCLKNMQMKTCLCTRLNQTLLVERVSDVKHRKIGKLKRDKFSILNVCHTESLCKFFVCALLSISRVLASRTVQNFN